ncbi:TNFAIP3-interacting protein 2 isoform X1 [Lates japonicus]|uniref:TNFAIP3-interacting protein 2 n=1 Tax=Lates japonicus TaxID=270547 RepID=A0AAD3R163_LATJO|nr:TNFAIP3-interacting protein 2 isoform X1 [Lates japonicus]
MDNVSMSADNDMLKDKIRSYSTLNTLYHETRQEIDLLNKQIYVKDNIIADLKARLGRYERIYMTVGDNDSVVIGPSKSLLESLCKEICKLKQKRNDMEFKASRQEEEIQRLNVQLREKELELESVRCQPDHEKDQEIQRLRSALEEREREKGGGELEEMGQQQKAKETPESADMSGVNTQIRQLQEENKQLKQRVAYVQGLNSQWQRYDSSREDYIRGLCQRLKETTGQGLMPGLGSVSTGLLHQEISRLNGLLEEKMSECARLGREMEEMRRKDQERIQTLEQQVLIYTEDFKSERTDRERAQGQIQDLKEQVYQLKQQLHKQQGASRENRDVVPMCRVHIGHRISTRRSKDNAERLLRTTAETQQQPAAAAATPNPAWSECLGLSDLQCPRCQAKFSESESAEYLKHWEECAKL